jgi:hypothetical protein
MAWVYHGPAMAQCDVHRVNLSVRYGVRLAWTRFVKVPECPSCAFAIPTLLFSSPCTASAAGYALLALSYLNVLHRRSRLRRLISALCAAAACRSPRPHAVHISLLLHSPYIVVRCTRSLFERRTVDALIFVFNRLLIAQWTLRKFSLKANSKRNLVILSNKFE